jgi:spermidine synthase
LSQTWFNETLYPDYQQRHLVERVLYEEKTGLQDLVIFESPRFGRMLTLDGVVQVTERDEFVYHEMLTHLPILAHGAVKKVCIIGGGDGGVLEEALKHKNVEKVTMVEIDRKVVDLCKEYMPSICGDAFEDPRTDLVIADGRAFAENPPEKYDLMIVDSTDPIGPGEKALFADATFYVAQVPTYAAGFMTLGWGCKDANLRNVPRETIESRYKAANLSSTKYYNPAIHFAAFALPNYIERLKS